MLLIEGTAHRHGIDPLRVPLQGLGPVRLNARRILRSMPSRSPKENPQVIAIKKSKTVIYINYWLYLAAS
ncbi:MAG: hypothetical protein WA191_00640 [Telluria sp.]